MWSMVNSWHFWPESQGFLVSSRRSEVMALVVVYFLLSQVCMTESERPNPPVAFVRYDKKFVMSLKVLQCILNTELHVLGWKHLFDEPRISIKLILNSNLNQKSFRSWKDWYTLSLETLAKKIHFFLLLLRRMFLRWKDILSLGARLISDGSFKGTGISNWQLYALIKRLQRKR